jgi:hypothetical protein
VIMTMRGVYHYSSTLYDLKSEKRKEEHAAVMNESKMMSMGSERTKR